MSSFVSSTSLTPARFLAVTAKIYHEQEKEPPDISKGEWKVILEHLGASPKEVRMCR